MSFLDQTEKSDLLGVRGNMLDASSCEKGCSALATGESQMSCSLLCDHIGTDTFTSLIDVSDYIGAQSMCDSHQVCERDDALAAIQLDMQMMSQSQTTNVTKAKPGNVTVNGDLTVTGSLKTKSIRSSALTVNGSITVTHAVRTEFLKADNTRSSVVETSTVSSPTGSVTLTGNLAMQNTAANAGTLSAAFLETQQLIQHGVRQWQLVHHDDFEEHAKDWTRPTAPPSCTRPAAAAHPTSSWAATASPSRAAPCTRRTARSPSTRTCASRRATTCSTRGRARLPSSSSTRSTHGPTALMPRPRRASTSAVASTP